MASELRIGKDVQRLRGAKVTREATNAANLKALTDAAPGTTVHSDLGWEGTKGTDGTWLIEGYTGRQRVEIMLGRVNGTH